MTQKIVIGVLVVLTLLLGYLYFSGATPPFGASSGPAHFQKESFLQGLTGGQRDQWSVSNAGLMTIGSSGTAITQILKGTCNLLGMDASATASTTSNYDCAVTGVQSGDVVHVQLSTTTPLT